MIWFIYAVSLPSIVLLILYILRFFPSRSTKDYVKALTAITWLASFSTLILVPGDVAAALKGRKSDLFSVWWQAAYWTIFALQVLILPIMQEYSRSGEFTVQAKMVQAVKRQVYYYLILSGLGVFGVIVMLVILKKIDFKSLLYFGLACSNAFGLLVGMLLLGFGLVEIPKTVINTASIKGRQKILHKLAAKQAEQAIQTQQELSKYVQTVKKLVLMFNKRDPLKIHMDQVEDELQEIDQDFQPIQVEVDTQELDFFNRKELAKLRANLRQAMEDYEREKSLYVDVVTQYSHVVDVLNNQERSCGPFESQLHTAAIQYQRQRLQGDGLYNILKQNPLFEQFLEKVDVSKNQKIQGVIGHLEWLWKCRWRGVFMKVSGSFLAIMSLSVVFSEATMNKLLPNLSPGSHLLRHAAKPQFNEFLTELLCYLLLAYPLTCAYFALCKMGKFKKYYLMVPRHTTGPCLLYNAQFYARFAAPLAFNFMMAIALPITQDPNGIDIEDTAFWKQIGQNMSKQPFIGLDMTLYLPLLLIPYVILVALGVFNKLIALFFGQKGLNLFDDGQADSEENTRKGKYLLNLEMQYLIQHGHLGILISNSNTQNYENAVAIMNKQQMSTHPSLESVKIIPQKQEKGCMDRKQSGLQNEKSSKINQNNNTLEYKPGQIAQQRSQKQPLEQTKGNVNKIYDYKLSNGGQDSRLNEVPTNQYINQGNVTWLERLKQSAIEIQNRFQDRSPEQQEAQIELNMQPRSQNQSASSLPQAQQHQQQQQLSLDNIFSDIAKSSLFQQIQAPFRSKYQRMDNQEH